MLCVTAVVADRRRPFVKRRHDAVVERTAVEELQIASERLLTPGVLFRTPAHRSPSNNASVFEHFSRACLRSGDFGHPSFPARLVE